MDYDRMVTALEQMAKAAHELSRALEEAAKTTGLTTEQLERLREAASQPKTKLK